MYRFSMLEFFIGIGTGVRGPWPLTFVQKNSTKIFILTPRTKRLKLIRQAANCSEVDVAGWIDGWVWMCKLHLLEVPS